MDKRETRSKRVMNFEKVDWAFTGCVKRPSFARKSPRAYLRG